MEIYFGTRNGFQRGVARMRDRSQAERPAAAMAKCARASTRSTGQTAGTVLLLLQWHALVEAITVAHIMRWGCMLGRLWPRVLCAILPTEVVIPVSGDWDWTLLQTRTIYQWRQTWPVHVLKAAWMP